MTWKFFSQKKSIIKSVLNIESMFIRTKGGPFFLRIHVLTGLFETVCSTLFVLEANAMEEEEAVLWVINNLILYARLVKRRGRGCANNRKGVELWKYYSYVKWAWARKDIGKAAVKITKTRDFTFRDWPRAEGHF